MQTPTQIKSSIISFLFFRIDFNKETKSFVFKNRIPLKEIDDSFFKNELTVIFKNISNHLVNGKENLVFLNDLLEIIVNKSKHFEKFQIDTLADVDNYFLDMNKMNNYKDSFFVFDSDEEEDNVNKQEFNFDDENKSEFIRIFNLAENYANLLFQFVDGLIIDFETIDFKEFDFDDYIKSHNIDLFQEFSNHENLKCLINYNKTEMANLFYLLLDEKIFHFSENERNNKVLFQKFIEQNFLYIGKENRISEIKAINKEFAKVQNDREKLQFEFLKDFRDMIDKRIIKISDRIDRRNKK